jgi:hypothetical protein
MEATFKNLFTIKDPYTHKGLSNHSTLSPIESGATVPLISDLILENYDNLKFVDGKKNPPSYMLPA